LTSRMGLLGGMLAWGMLPLFLAIYMASIGVQDRMTFCLSAGRALTTALPFIPLSESAEASTLKLLMRVGAVPTGSLGGRLKEDTPSMEDVESARKRVAENVEQLWPLDRHTCVVSPTTIDQVKGYWITTPSTKNETNSPVMMYAHGGGFVAGGGLAFAGLGCALAKDFGLRVMMVDYRLPPESPLTHAYEDFLSVFRALGIPKKIVFFGHGSGGNVALSTLMRLRSLGTYMPAATVLVSPTLDLTRAFPPQKKEEGEDPSLSLDDIDRQAAMALGQLGEKKNEGGTEEEEEAMRYEQLHLLSPALHDTIALAPVSFFWEKTEAEADAIAYTWNGARKLGVRNVHVQRTGLWHQYALWFNYIPEARLDMNEAKKFALGLLEAHSKAKNSQPEGDDPETPMKEQSETNE